MNFNYLQETGIVICYSLRPMGLKSQRRFTKTHTLFISENGKLLQAGKA